MKATDYRVNIIGLSQNSHRFDFVIGDEFFKHYGTALLDSGRFNAEIDLDKRETLIEVKFHIHGEAHLECDRSLEPFDFPMHFTRTIMFKYSQEEKELSEEIVLISRERTSLDLGQYMYELINVQVPMKRLHPKFKDDEKEVDEIRLVYSSPVDADKKEEDQIDPRWEVLKKLK
ncbi:MAG: DUF177 domain-containing protein [Cytophagales bacterium]|nr:DUF177 domain-containing protein [Cytophagales bacterium]